jgi:PKD repeat protein
MSSSSRPRLLLLAAVISVCHGCSDISGTEFPYVATPKATVGTPASPASADITIPFSLIDRELDPADIELEYSTDGGQTYTSATLKNPAEGSGLATGWHPGKTHTVTWNSVADMVGRSGATSVCVKITPSDASNPSGTPGVSGTFTVNNTAYNEAPAATVSTPSGVQSGNIQINYFLADVESDTCSVQVLYSTNDGTTWQSATMGAAGDGLTGLPSSPSGTAHMYLWNSRADNVALSGQADTIKVRITPTDFNAGTSGETNSFSVDNSVANNPPTVAITSGPADGSTVTTTQVTFTWSGSDTDGTVTGYYYSFDHDPPDTWTTDTTVTSSPLSEGQHTFRVVAMDDDSDLSTVASRSFTVTIPGTITAQFIASPLSGPAPLTVDFTDLSTATNGITGWSWTFGDMAASSAQNPQHVYPGEGTFTVSLTVTGPDGSDIETKMNYITVASPGGDTVYVDGANGDDSRSGLDWANAVRTIQTGLDKASDNWTVLVADGTYTGTSNVRLDFSGKAARLVSASGAGSCALDGEGSGYGVYLTSAETTNTIIEGFTIRNFEMGIRCYDSGLKILNCAIVENNAPNVGGGIYCRGADLIIVNSLIADNTAMNYGGGISLDGVSATIANCIIAGNWAKNWGSGIDLRESDAILNNTIIWGNTPYRQIRTQDANCTVTMNHCDYANGIEDVVGYGTVVPNNCITLDPLFENAAAQDYRLQAGSPCIDAGDNSLVPPGITTDLDGNMRIFDGDGDTTTTVDIGAYEYGSIRNWVLRSVATEPSARLRHGMVYDSSRAVMVLFGGNLEGANQYSDETWEWNGSNWTQKYPANKPSQRCSLSMAYDSAREVTVLFGGSYYDGSNHYYDDTWEWDGSNWNLKNPVNKPSGRCAHSMAYDPNRGVVVLYGGYPENNETWEWNGTNWTKKLPTPNPGNQYRHALVYDSKQGVITLFRPSLSSVWEWDGANWTETITSGSAPHGRSEFNVAYDSRRGVTLLYGGFYLDGATDVYCDDTWEWNGVGWTQKFPADNPTKLIEHAMAFDSNRGVVVLVGGWSYTHSSLINDTWEY